MNVQIIRDLVAKIEAGLISKSQNGDYLEYNSDRRNLISIRGLRDYIPKFVINSPNLDIAFAHMKNYASGSGSWAARRQFVADQFFKLREHLDILEGNAVILSEEDISGISLPEVSTQLNRAKMAISSDPASAVTKAETVLAAVCKYILESEKEAVGKSETLISLVSRNARGVLRMEQEFGLQNFSGISNQAQLVAEIRNRYGDAHPAPSPDDYLAEFAVTTAGSLAILLLKRYEIRNVGGNA